MGAWKPHHICGMSLPMCAVRPGREEAPLDSITGKSPLLVSNAILFITNRLQQATGMISLIISLMMTKTLKDCLVVTQRYSHQHHTVAISYCWLNQSEWISPDRPSNHPLPYHLSMWLIRVRSWTPKKGIDTSSLQLTQLIGRQGDHPRRILTSCF